MNYPPNKKFTKDNNIKLLNKRNKRFDALLKRIMEDFSQDMFKALLGLEPLSIKLVEREFPRVQVSSRHVDFLARTRYKMGIAQEREEIFHIEFQTNNDLSMPQRMLRYALDIYEREKEFPSQVVIYIGNEELKMKESFNEIKSFSHLNYSFKIIDVSKISADTFLINNNPNIAILAVLGHFDDAETLVTKILKLLSNYYGFSEKLRISISKLEIVCQLRGLTPLLYKKVNEMLGIDITELESYKEGMKEGKKEGMKEGIITLGLSLLEKKFNLDSDELSQLKKQLLEISDIIILQEILKSMLEQNNYNEALKILRIKYKK